MKKLIVLLTTLLILQGCSFKQTFSDEEARSLATSANISNISSASFDTKNNKLIVNTTDEVIDKTGFDALLETLSLTTLSNKTVKLASLNKKEFNNKNFSIEVVAKNNNSVTFFIDDINNKNYNISQKKYSDDYIKNELENFSNKLISFDEVVGVIETDLNKGRSLGSKEETFNSLRAELASEFSKMKTFTKDNSSFDNIDKVESSLTRLESLVANVESATTSALNTKTSSTISAVFLSINDIDKIARELKTL